MAEFADIGLNGIVPWHPATYTALDYARSPRPPVMNDLVQLLRPKHWVKNVFVFAPLAFTGRFLDPAALADSLLAFVMFCIAASMVYAFNDWADVERDRRHPVKRLSRPYAAGRISTAQLWTVIAVLAMVLALLALLKPEVMVAITAYIALIVFYSLDLKHRPVIDVFTIALGFVLRVYVGGLAIGVEVSAWMFICTLTLALFLASIKRRQELLHGVQGTREVLSSYGPAVVEHFAEMSATGALVFYSLFVVSEKPQLVFTIPLVLFGLFRYWYLVYQEGSGESPTDLLFADGQLITVILLWGLSCLYGLWPAV